MSDTISDLGEFGLIARVTGRFPRTEEVILGPGDDAAIIRAGEGRSVAATDLLVEGRHFRRDWSGGRDVGAKAAAQNFADIAAMGARPTALLLGLAAPADLPLAWVDEMAEGLRAECARAGATLAGGDTVESPTLTLAITAMGELDGREPVLRSGARPGDILALAGTLGRSAAGFELLRAGLAGPAGCLRAHRRPEPCYAAAAAAGRAGATAMLDVSDGLVQDLGHIARAGGVALDVDGARLDSDPELEEAAALLRSAGAPGTVTAREWMLHGGEDHAFAAAFPSGTPLPPEWTRIGTVAEGEGVTVDGAEIHPAGWRHFLA